MPRRCGPISRRPRSPSTRRGRVPGVGFRGLMTCQGWVKGTEAERAAQLREENDRLLRVRDDLAAAGIAIEEMSGGSTPTLFQSHLLEPVTDNRAGTYVFND